MEFHISSSTPVIVILSIVALIFLFQIFKTKTGKSRKPPQAKGAWPIIGHLHLLAGSELPHKVLGNMADKYGPIFTIKLGVHQALVVSDGETARECFTTNDKVFATRPKAVAVELMGYDYAMFGLAPYGEYWRQVRKIVMLELLSQRRIEMLGRVRVSEVRASLREIYLAWHNKESGVVVEMKQWFRNLVFNMVVRMIFGKRFLAESQEGVRFQEVTKKFLGLLGEFVVSDAIPCLRYLDVGGYEKSMKMTAREMDNIFQGWLEEHMSERESEGNRGFMDAIISILQESSKKDFHGIDRDTTVKASCLALLIAAIDTTTVILTWVLSLFLNNPKALKIAQDELDIHVGRERQVEESDIKNLVYLQAVVKETLRLYPPAPLSLPHESMEDCVVRGYKIPKGTRLLVNLWKLHRDPNIWSDPYDFQPERFLTSQKHIDVKGQHFELLPFGSGRRMCPGVSLALPILHLTIASLIQGFELVKPSNEPIDMSESPGITNIKATPLDVLVTPRLSLNKYHVDA